MRACSERKQALLLPSNDVVVAECVLQQRAADTLWRPPEPHGFHHRQHRTGAVYNEPAPHT